MTTATLQRPETPRTSQQTENDYRQARISALEFVRARYTCALETFGKVDRDRITEQTTRFVMTLLDCSQRTAETIAAQAVGEWDSRGNTVQFEIDRSTAHVIFLRDSRNGHSHAITATELRSMLASFGHAY